MTGVDTDLATLLPSECPNCGRLHAGYDFNANPGPVQAELSRLRELCVAIDTGTFDTQRERAEAAEAELSRLHDHRDYDVWNERILRRAAEARLGEAHRECARLQQERDALIERDFWASQTIREQETELVRLREMLARVRPDIDPETGYGRVEAI